MFSVKSLIYIKKNKGPRIEPCGTPAQMSPQLEDWPFRTVLCFLSAKKFLRSDSRSPETPHCLSLNMRPSCHTLSKALEMSK